VLAESGDWAYAAGVPAKSGVGGGVLPVVPGRLAVAAFSPRLDAARNSVRGWFAVDLYPFRLNLPVVAKLGFVHHVLITAKTAEAV
jgi:glutaminase